MSKHTGIPTTLVAFVAAVFVALLAVPATHCVALGVGLSSRGTCAGSLAGYLAFGSIIAFPAAFIFGVPFYLAFRKFGWMSWWQVPIGAGLAGVLAAAAFHAIDRTTHLLGMLGLFGGLGALAGVAFWCFNLRRS